MHDHESGPVIAGRCTFQVEDFAKAFAEATELTRRHYDEIAKNKDVMVLDPDRDFYAAAKDTLLLVTARHEGALAGYFLWVLIQHPHYRTVRLADEDLHFLAPEYRQGMTGYRLMKAARDAAIARGAKLLMMREKIGHERPGVLRRLGFAPADINHILIVRGDSCP